MAFEKNTVILKWDSNPGISNPDETSFETILDETCERLWEKRIEYSVRRITEMDEMLLNLEKKLDEFLGPKTGPAQVRKPGRRAAYGQKSTANE